MSIPLIAWSRVHLERHGRPNSGRGTLGRRHFDARIIDVLVRLVHTGLMAMRRQFCGRQATRLLEPDPHERGMNMFAGDFFVKRTFIFIAM